ncbi:MAG: response regulator, partial [Gammaproteobacteria bacterium]|nr:response regulator [Gammaproteobacteria bacterium]
GFAEILKEQLCGFPQYQDSLNRIMDGGHTLLHLIDDILDLSRIEAGQLEIRPEAVNLRAILTEIQQMFASKVRAKGIAFTRHISPDIPDTVLLDGNRLRQILMNLIGNAVKYTEQGSVTLEVRRHRFSDIKSVEALTTNGKTAEAFPTNILFEVRDTGIGIPQDEQARMFEPFQQHDPRSSGGTGLGLAITKRVVELMQGSIAVESTVDEGTLFRVLLPATGIAVREEEGSAGKAREQIHFHGATVLLVEDNAPNREVVRAYVASHDLRLIEAENGQDALQILTCPAREGPGRGSRPDLILMDLRMPVMDGYEAT